MSRKMQYQLLDTSRIKPTGWLKKQLEIQAEGLAGNLDKIWPDVRDSAWIGGTREGWERVPYWLDGFIPLAYLLEDEDMIARAKKYIDAILSRQQPDGWICPCTDEERRTYDTWAVLLITKVLCLYYDCSGDGRIIDAVSRCLKQFNTHLSHHTLHSWGAARWFEGLIAAHWLYEKTGESWILTLIKRLRVQGDDWRYIFRSGLLEDTTDDWDFHSHIVNIAMMLKSEALLSLFDDEVDPEEFANLALEYLDREHGTAIGHFNGDENLSGNSPIQGAELCSIVELMYSYKYLFMITGNPKFLDRLEALAYNSLPATCSPDMWSHQYDQLVNQVAAFPMSKPTFRSNGRESHLFGLEPNYGCCTANMGQGWPKFAMTTFMKSNNGIAACALAPAKVNTEINSVSVSCQLMTEYPFRNTLTYQVTTEAPVTFTLSVRIPSCAAAARVDGEAATPGGFFHITRSWQGEETVTVALDFETEVVQRPEDMVCIRRGPLFYSIPIKENWERVEYTQNGVERRFPYCDYYIFPESKWNYALAEDTFTVSENAFDAPFDTANPPVSITARMAEIQWGFHNGHCDRLPASAAPLGEAQEVTMIPYGCTNLRMTEIPYITKRLRRSALGAVGATCALLSPCAFRR